MFNLLTSERFVKEMAKFGAIGIIAGVLLTVFINDVRADQHKNREEHIALRDSIERNNNLMGQFLMSQERVVYLQRRQCINTARNDDAREACAKDKD